MALDKLFDKPKEELIEMLMSEQQRRKYYVKLYHKAAKEMWKWVEIERKHHILYSQKIAELRGQISDRTIQEFNTEKPLENGEAIIFLNDEDTIKTPDAIITVPQGKWLQIRVKEPYEVIRKKK